MRDDNTCLRLLLIASLLAIAPNLAFSQTPIEHVDAPGGKVVYYIMQMPTTDAEGNPNLAIEETRNLNRSFRTLVTSRPSGDPKQNLTGFSHLALSPDGKMLYFQTAAWATSNAIHDINLSNGKVLYVTSGELACVVLSGEHQGDLIVEQHRYFIEGRSHDDLWLYSPSGKQIGQVAQGTDASKVCPTLGN